MALGGGGQVPAQAVSLRYGEQRPPPLSTVSGDNHMSPMLPLGTEEMETLAFVFSSSP